MAACFPSAFPSLRRTGREAGFRGSCQQALLFSSSRKGWQNNSKDSGKIEIKISPKTNKRTPHPAGGKTKPQQNQPSPPRPPCSALGLLRFRGDKIQRPNKIRKVLVSFLVVVIKSINWLCRQLKKTGVAKKAPLIFQSLLSGGGNWPGRRSRLFTRVFQGLRMEIIIIPLLTGRLSPFL